MNPLKISFEQYGRMWGSMHEYLDVLDIQIGMDESIHIITYLEDYR